MNKLYLVFYLIFYVFITPSWSESPWGVDMSGQYKIPVKVQSVHFTKTFASGSCFYEDSVVIRNSIFDSTVAFIYDTFNVDLQFYECTLNSGGELTKIKYGNPLFHKCEIAAPFLVYGHDIGSISFTNCSLKDSLNLIIIGDFFIDFSRSKFSNVISIKTNHSFVDRVYLEYFETDSTLDLSKRYYPKYFDKYHEKSPYKNKKTKLYLYKSDISKLVFNSDSFQLDFRNLKGEPELTFKDTIEVYEDVISHMKELRDKKSADEFQVQLDNILSSRSQRKSIKIYLIVLSFLIALVLYIKRVLKKNTM